MTRVVHVTDRAVFTVALIRDSVSYDEFRPAIFLCNYSFFNLDQQIIRRLTVNSKHFLQNTTVIIAFKLFRNKPASDKIQTKTKYSKSLIKL